MTTFFRPKVLPQQFLYKGLLVANRASVLQKSTQDKFGVLGVFSYHVLLGNRPRFDLSENVFILSIFLKDIPDLIYVKS